MGVKGCRMHMPMHMPRARSRLSAHADVYVAYALSAHAGNCGNPNPKARPSGAGPTGQRRPPDLPSWGGAVSMLGCRLGLALGRAIDVGVDERHCDGAMQASGICLAVHSAQADDTGTKGKDSTHDQRTSMVWRP